MKELNKIYDKIYETSYNTNNNINKKTLTYKYLKPLLYLQYIFIYILLYFHNNKGKIIEKVPSFYDKDYIFLFILISFTPVLIYIIWEKFFKTKDKICSYLIIGSYFLLCLFLIIFNYLNLVFAYKKIYYYTGIFFNIFQFLGICLPFIFINQLILLLILGSFLLLKFFVNSISYNLFGVWGYLPFSKLFMLIGILCLYILSSIFLDIFFKDKQVFKKKEKLSKFTEEKINDSNKINEIYNKIKEQNVEVHMEEKTEEPVSKEENFPIFSNEIINKIYLNVEKKFNNIEDLSDKIINLLQTFYINGEIFNIIPAATVTNYFFKPKSGTKTSRIESVEEELSMELNRNVRVASNIKGIIFEVENKTPNYFSFKDLYFHINESPEKTNHIKSKYILPLFLGFDTFGEEIILDLTKQPHLLMAGTTGSGKSSTLHTIIHSLIVNKTSEEVKFLFIDPKILELSIYKNIPYLWKPIITSIEEGEKALEDLIKEMEMRYKTMSQCNKRSIIEYNKTYKPFPYIVFAIEEFADLALYKNSTFKTSVQRLAQMGRAAGIHGIICTQRPSANVIDGVIKANFPTRIALKVANKLESRIILDTSGADKLSNPGEMIILDSSGITKRGICPYIREEEIINLINFIKN
jgi:S-DNA-T family DNA segregation ATPase FtsK/SpoIIIE